MNELAVIRMNWGSIFLERENIRMNWQTYELGFRFFGGRRYTNELEDIRMNWGCRQTGRPRLPVTV